VILGLGGVANHIMKFTTGWGYFSRAVLAQNLSAVTAACMLLKKDAFLQVGGFDEEKFAVAYNDVDLCLKIRAAGLLIVYTPYAELVHHESVSRGYEDSPEKKARFELEFDAMRAKWGGILDRDPYHNPNFSKDSLQLEYAFPPSHARPWESPM
jgi:GT2 family glycosyltransferase